MSTDASNPVLFEAVIVPHRSLGKAGMRYLIGALASLSCLVAIGLWIAGAWPAIGFTGLEVTLASLASAPPRLDRGRIRDPTAIR